MYQFAQECTNLIADSPQKGGLFLVLQLTNNKEEPKSPISPAEARQLRAFVNFVCVAGDFAESAAMPQFQRRAPVWNA